MAPKLVEKVLLDNGLVLELWDQSRPLAADRWLVSLLARIEVPVEPHFFSELHDAQQAYRQVVSAYGNPLVFTQEKTRQFVDAREVEDTLSGLLQRFKDNLIIYLSNPKFASHYSLKKYSDLQERQRWAPNTL